MVDFQNTIFGHNFWLECPTKVISTQLSYILKALFRDTPLAYSFCTSGAGGQVAGITKKRSQNLSFDQK